MSNRCLLSLLFSFFAAGAGAAAVLLALAIAKARIASLSLPSINSAPVACPRVLRNCGCGVAVRREPNEKDRQNESVQP